MHPVLRRSLVGMVCVGGLLSPAWGQQLRLLDCAQFSFCTGLCSGPARRGSRPTRPAAGAPLSARDDGPGHAAPALKLLEEPTLANAEAFVTWQQEREARDQRRTGSSWANHQHVTLSPRRGVDDALPRNAVPEMAWWG